MFGLFKKRIPAPESERQTLVRRIFIEHCESEPEATRAATMGLDPREIPIEMLMEGSPESIILTIVEQFLVMRDKGFTEEFAVKSLNQFHGSVLPTAGHELPVLQHVATFFQYVRHVMDALYSHRVRLSDHFLIDAIQEIRCFYKR